MDHVPNTKLTIDTSSFQSANNPISDTELEVLIQRAVKTGENLDALIRGRKIAGGPPALAIRMIIV